MSEIELLVDAGQVPSADRFFKAGSHLIDLLDELVEVPVEWAVSGLRMSSAVALVRGPIGEAEVELALTDAVRGLQLISRGGAAPESWSPDAISAARHLVHVVAGDAADGPETVSHLRLVSDVEPDAGPIHLNRQLSRRLRDIQPFTRSMPGVVRGQVVGMNVSRGNRASIRPIAGRVIRVAFSNDLRLDLKNAMLDNVEIAGVISQDGDGRVYHVRAESVQPMTVPTLKWSELFGYDPEITGGLSVAEYLEDIRGEA